MNTTASSAAPKGTELWTVRGLIARHKPVAASIAAVIAVMLAMILVAVLGAKGGAVTDATTCSSWSSTNQTKQVAYAKLYFERHGPLPDGATSPASVIAAINNGCEQAFGEDVSDTTTVVQAISGKF